MKALKPELPESPAFGQYILSITVLHYSSGPWKKKIGLSFPEVVHVPSPHYPCFLSDSTVPERSGFLQGRPAAPQSAYAAAARGAADGGKEAVEESPNPLNTPLLLPH